MSSFYLHCFCSRAHHFLHMSPPPPPTESLFSFICFVSLVFFCHLPLSSALHLFMLCSHSLGVLPLFSLYAVAARAQLIFVGSFFVHVVCVCVSDEFFCVYHFFVGRRAATLTLASCFLGPPVECFFFNCSCCYICCTSVCLCMFYLTPLSLHTTSTFYNTVSFELDICFLCGNKEQHDVH